MNFVAKRLECARFALLLTECVASSAESQRDSATKPRVARNGLPWENAPHIGDNPERVVADDHGNRTMPQPRWGCESSVALPGVARSSQPWAEFHNPFGIEDTGKEQRLAGAFPCHTGCPAPICVRGEVTRNVQKSRASTFLAPPGSA